MWDYWPSLLGNCVVLLGVKRDVMAPSADCIMVGCIWGSSNDLNCHHAGAFWLAHFYMMFHYEAGGSGHQGCVRVNGGAIGRTLSMDWDIVFVNFVSGLD